MRLPGKSLFGSSTPAIPELPPLPDRNAEDIAARRKQTASAARRSRGRGSTRLSGGLGDPSEANVERPALTRLGG